MGKNGPTRPNKSGQGTLADVIMTPEDSAIAIIEYFNPTGIILEPCRGTGNIYNNLPQTKLWCEISQGKDFFDFNEKVDWIITNPPYSIYDKFLEHSIDLAEEIVFLVPLSKFFRGIKLENKIREWGGIKEILHLGTGSKLGFTFGFPVGCIHYSKGYSGDVKYTKWF